MPKITQIKDILKVERFIIFDFLFSGLVFLAFFERTLNMLTNNALKPFGFTDEVIQVMAILILVLGIFIDIISPQFMWVFAYIIIFHVLSVYTTPYYRGPVDTFIAQMIHFKYMLFVVALTTGAQNMYIWRKLFDLVVLISILGLVAHIAMGTTWNKIFNSTILRRYGLLRHHGLYKNANAQAYYITIYAMHLLTKERNVNLFYLPIIVVVSSIIFAVFTSTRTSIVTIVIAGFYMLLRKENFPQKYLIVIGLLVGMAGFLAVKGGKMIETTQNNLSFATEGDAEGYMRGIVILYSFKVADKHYPFGSGFGTYCSITSSASPVYADMNIPRRRLFEGGLAGVYDSSFATILGETGYLGMWLYYLLFIILLRSLKKGQSKNNRYFIDMLIVSTIFFSFTNPIFSNSYPAIIVAIFLVVRLKGRHNQIKYPIEEQVDNRPKWKKYFFA